MQSIVEFLPVLFGLLIAGLSHRLRPVYFAYYASIWLCLMAGTFVNLLSGEGVGFVIVDIATTAASAFGFIVLQNVVSARIQVRA